MIFLHIEVWYYKNIFATGIYLSNMLHTHILKSHLRNDKGFLKEWNFLLDLIKPIWAWVLLDVFEWVL